MRKTAVLILTALAALFLLAGCSKASWPAVSNYVFDQGDFLTAEQEQQIQNHILELRDKVQADFIVVFTDSPASNDYRAEAEKCNNSFVSSGGGYGEEKETICFYVDMANRFFFVDEYNVNKNWRLSDGDIDGIVQGTVRDYMSQGNYYGASMQFVDDAYGATKPGFFGTIWGWLTSGLAGGGALSGILIGRHKRQPATPKTFYRKDNGTVPLRANDRFMGTTTEVRHIERQQSSDSGGGPSTIDSSSGSDGHHGGGASF